MQKYRLERRRTIHCTDRPDRKRQWSLFASDRQQLSTEQDELNPTGKELVYANCCFKSREIPMHRS